MKNWLLKFFAAAAFLFLSAAVVTYFLTKHEVKKSVRDLAETKAQIISYSFLEGVKGTGQYTIHLSGYTAAFQVRPEDVQYFAKARFEKNLKKGDTLSVWISPDSAASLTSPGPVPIFAARTETATYLDEYYTLGASNSGYVNDNKFPMPLVPVFLWVGVAFLILWILAAVVIWIRSRKVSEEPPGRESVSTPDGAFISQSSQRLKRIVAKGYLEPKSTEPDRASMPVCTLEQIPVVFEQLKQKGHDGSFAIFMFDPPGVSNTDDAINIQFSIENGRIGLDWCLIGAANIRDIEKFEGFIAAHGQRPRMMEVNQVKYLRVEHGDLPLLCQGVIIELYAMRCDVKLDMAVQGFPWPPSAPPVISAGGPVENSQEPAAAQLT